MKKTILVIDDMPDERKLVRLLLRRFDCQVHEAGNGADGLQLARKVKPMLVLIDHMMPQTSGYDTIRLFREDLELSHVPIVMLTARKFDPGFRDFMRQQIDDFLAKPVESKTLLETIQRLIGGLSPLPVAAAKA